MTNQASEASAFSAAYDALLRQWPDGHRGIDVATPYGTTRVNVCGPDDGPPLVLFHGYGATAAVWFAVAGELSRTWRVLAVDRPGEAGRSVSDGKDMRNAEDALDWIAALCSGLELSNFALCGHSFGAWLALRYALCAPGKVSALALLDPTQCFAGYRPGYLLRSLPMLTRPSAARTGAFLAWETAGLQVSDDWLRLAALCAAPPSAVARSVRRPSRTALGGLAAPTLVVLAGRSKAHNVGRVAAAARESIPGVRVEVLDGVSHHSIPAAQAGPLSRLLLGFLPAQPADQ